MKLGRPRLAELDFKIRDAAMALIREGGVSAMSLDQVADRIGVSKPTIYRRYASKADLVVASIVEACKPGGPEPTNDSLRDVVGLLEYFRFHFEANIQLPALGSLLQASRTNPDLIEAFRASAIHVYRRQLQRAVLAAQQAALLQPAADAATIVEMLIGAYYARAISGEPFADFWSKQLLTRSGLLTAEGHCRLAALEGRPATIDDQLVPGREA